MKLIKLTKGEFAIVDDQDFEWLNQCKWQYCHGYACRKLGKTTISMQRFIMVTPKGLETDHVNGNKLDNRRTNLRICTHQENHRNTSKQSNNKSGYKGVSWHYDKRKNWGKWKVAITVNKRKIFIGYFSNKLEAAKAYDCKAKELFGDFARLNFL
jgi:hypothetical protein